MLDCFRVDIEPNHIALAADQDPCQISRPATQIQNALAFADGLDHERKTFADVHLGVDRAVASDWSEIWKALRHGDASNEFLALRHRKGERLRPIQKEP
ncbi:MAG: hypothetical protein M3R30_01445 [Candidatus Eremiobacteraeota bacterium]|nr:hypothetical protein [Candidatus Eremiobacteraeota bacterium]